MLLTDVLQCTGQSPQPPIHKDLVYFGPNVSCAKDWESSGLKRFISFFRDPCFLFQFSRCFLNSWVAAVSFFVDGKFCQLWIPCGPGEWNPRATWRAYLIQQWRLPPLSSSAFPFVHLPVMCTPRRVSQDPIFLCSFPAALPSPLHPLVETTCEVAWGLLGFRMGGGGNQRPGRRACSGYRADNLLSVFGNLFCCWCRFGALNYPWGAVYQVVGWRLTFSYPHQEPKQSMTRAPWAQGCLALMSLKVKGLGHLKPSCG